MRTLRLRYGNTNTYLIQGSQGMLLVDTDVAGTLGGLFRALKAENVRVSDLSYVMATHYHPDHAGLLGTLQQRGVPLLILQEQLSAVHFPDAIYQKEKNPEYVPICEAQAKIIPCHESRTFLKRLGIDGEICQTPSHSADSVSVFLEDGTALLGDLEPEEYLAAYEENLPLKRDWETVYGHAPKRLCYAHVNEKMK